MDLRCLQGNTGIRTVNPDKYNFTDNIPTRISNSVVNLSPPKFLPVEKTVTTWNHGDGRQTTTTYINSVKIADGIHDKCPKLQCRSTLIALDNGLYRSQKCDNDYFLASTGIRLTLDISPTDVLKGKVIIFNELAEQLLGKTSI